MPDLDYAKVTGRFGLTVGDTLSDVDDDPDTVWCDSGRVLITPLNTFLKVAGAASGPFTAGGAVIEAEIGPDGRLLYQGKNYLYVVDLTSAKVNPQIAPGKATHKVTFSEVMAGTTRVDFPEFTCRLTAAGDGVSAGAVNDLTVVAPVVPGAASPIYRGEQGVSVTSLSVDAGNLVATFTDGTELNAGPLPVGPGGSDPGVAGYIASPSSETAAAIKVSMAPIKAKRVLGGDFGLKADGRHANDAVITKGQQTVTSTNIGFTSADIGKRLMTVTDYNSGSPNSRWLGTAITAGTALSAVTSIVLQTGLTNALSDGDPVWIIAFGVRHYGQVNGAHAAGAATVAVRNFAVDLYGKTTFEMGAPAFGSRNAAWVMFPVSTTVVGTITAVNGNVATHNGNPAPSSTSSIALFVGTDDADAIDAMILEAQKSIASTPTRYPAGKGALVELPRGIILTSRVHEIDGAFQVLDYGGVGIKGAGRAATRVVCASLSQAGFAFGAANTATISDTQFVNDVEMSDFAMQGPGMMHRGTVGFDKRSSGGSYVYDSIQFDSFDFGVRHHDMYALVATDITFKRCWIARAIGYQGDIQQWNSPYANHCGIDLYLGYTDPNRTQVPGANGWRAHTEFSASATGCMVGIYVEGSGTSGQFTSVGRHDEFFADRAVRIGDGASLHAVQGGIEIKAGANQSRPVADIFGPTGRRDHAYEINRGFSVKLDIGYTSQTGDAPVWIKDSTANVQLDIASTFYATADNVQGDVLDPTGAYAWVNPPTASPAAGNAAQKARYRWGRWAAEPTPRCAALPGGVQLTSGAWAGRRLTLTTDGVTYHCEQVAGTWTWVAVSSVTAVNKATAVTDRSSKTAQTVVANTITETTVHTHTIPGGTVSSGSTYRVRAGGTIQNVATSGNLTLRVRIGGTTIATFLALSVGSASSTGRWALDCDIVLRGSSGSAIPASVGLANIKLGGTTVALADSAVGSASNYGNGSDKDVTVTVQWATADPANSLTCEVATVSRVV